MASTVIISTPSNDVEMFYTPSIIEEASSYFIISDRDSIPIPTDADGNNADYTEADTTFRVEYKGEDVTSDWTFYLHGITDVTVSAVGSVFTVTTISEDIGSFIVRGSRTGYNSIYRKINVFKSKQGEQGIQGETGDTGAQGDAGTSITWLGTFSSAPSSPDLNDAYRNSTLKASYVWDGDSWELMNQDGSVSNVDNTTIGLNGSSNLSSLIFTKSTSGTNNFYFTPAAGSVSNSTNSINLSNGSINRSNYGISVGGSQLGTTGYTLNYPFTSNKGYIGAYSSLYSANYANASNLGVVIGSNNSQAINRGLCVVDSDYSFAHGINGVALYRSSRGFSSASNDTLSLYFSGDPNPGTGTGSSFASYGVECPFVGGQEFHAYAITTNAAQTSTVLISGIDRISIGTSAAMYFTVYYVAQSTKNTDTTGREIAANYAHKQCGLLTRDSTITGSGTVSLTMSSTNYNEVDGFTSIHGAKPTLTITADNVNKALNLAVDTSSITLGSSYERIVHSVIIDVNYLKFQF